MRNDKFWDTCTKDSIREKVAQFIDQSPLLSKFKDTKYYELEDAIVEFVEQNRDFIAAEVDREYQREDLIEHAVEDYGKEAAQVVALMPIKKIDAIIEAWQDALVDRDLYWDEVWQPLTDALEEVPDLAFLDDYDHDDIVIYMAYLQEWYASHDAEVENPVCIDDFFNNEMDDRETAKHYKKLAVKFKKEHNLN